MYVLKGGPHNLFPGSLQPRHAIHLMISGGKARPDSAIRETLAACGNWKERERVNSISVMQSYAAVD
jgi:hypothetical protein